MNRRMNEMQAVMQQKMQQKRSSQHSQKEQDSQRQFDQLEASSLYCPRCKMAAPVRKRLLLVLPEGERFEYLCAQCSTSVGRKLEEKKQKIDLIVKP